MLIRDDVLGGIDEAIEEALEEPNAELPPPDALRALRPDLSRLGLFGLITILPNSPPPTEEVYAEQARQVTWRLLRGLQPDDAPIDLDGAPPLETVLARYAEAKGESVTRRAIENELFEFYDLQDHGLFVDDVTKAFDVVRATRPPTDDVKTFIRAAARLSGQTAKFILGLFPEQIQLIHRITMRQAEPHEIDKAFCDFGPRAIRLRLYGVLASLLQNEKRIRLSLTLWARGRGVAITREQVLAIPDYLELKSHAKLLHRAVERHDAIRAFLEFREAHPAIAALERFL